MKIRLGERPQVTKKMIRERRMSHRDCEIPVSAKHPPRIVIPKQFYRNVLITHITYIVQRFLSVFISFLFSEIG